jgi:hypothetical protein
MVWATVSTILVDFVILTKNGHVPRASTIIEDQGFYATCKGTCPVATVLGDDGVTTFPRMEFCPCVAELLVADLAEDFQALSKDVSFKLGDYRTLDAPDFFRAKDGHAALTGLMFDPPASAAARAPERVTVWIADRLPSSTPNAHLEGSTFLTQLLGHGVPGAGLVLLGSVTRAGRRLSHEVGHIVGFHHTAGMGLDFKYNYNVCEPSVEWAVLQKPTCELNIMGGWYDGPFCCPGSEPTEEKSCKVGPIGRYCCGDECTHSCPETAPPMTFATAEHAEIMRSILKCWVSFVGKELNSTDSQHVYSFAHTSSSPLTYTEDYVEAAAADRWRLEPPTAGSQPPERAGSQTTAGKAPVLAAAKVGQSRPVSVRRLQEETGAVEDGIVFL